MIIILITIMIIGELVVDADLYDMSRARRMVLCVNAVVATVVAWDSRATPALAGIQLEEL